MSQPRMRKAPVVTTCNGPRPRAAISKASGDPGPCVPAQKQQDKRSRNKIPKTIRYDLENALVGLCDVWFEEIKPHLVRNNIKLHVYGGAGPAGGDHRRLPPGAPGCSHLDPGAASDHSPRPAVSCVGCCLTPPTVLRAPSLKLPTRPARSRSRRLLPSPPFPLSPPLINQNLDSKEDRTSKHRLRRNSCSPKPPSGQATRRVPRTCRTYSVLSPPVTPQTILRSIRTATQPQQQRQSLVCHTIIEMKNKSTQTEMFSSHMRCSVQQKRMLPNPFGRCTATTTFFPIKYEKNTTASPKNCIHQSRISKQAFFSKEIVNIVEEKHDKLLKLLYKSPVRGECSSILNLVQSPTDNHTKANNKKKRPWR